MFKNIVPFLVVNNMPSSRQDLEKALDKAAFRKCGAMDRETSGFVPVRDGDGRAVAIGGEWLMRLRHEKKVLPGGAVRKILDERIAEIQKKEGRVIGKKEKKELKERIIDELLPKALIVDSEMLIWFSPDRNLALVGASSRKKAEDAVALVMHACDPTPDVLPVAFKRSPEAAMHSWLTCGEVDGDFTIDDKCELVMPEDKSTVRYVHHNLEGQDVRNHLSTGKMPKSLAMTWNDRVSFVLTDTLEIKGIKLLEAAMEDFTPGDDDVSTFDAQFLLETGEIGKVIEDLFDAIGLED